MGDSCRKFRRNICPANVFPLMEVLTTKAPVGVPETPSFSRSGGSYEFLDSA